MKKLWISICMFALVFTLSGCGMESPTTAVVNYFDELKKGTNGEFEHLLEDSVEKKEEEKIGKSSKVNDETFKIIGQKTDVKVVSEEINGDNATVKAKVTGVNFGTIMVEIFGETLGQAFTGKEFTEEEMDQKLLEKIKADTPTERTGDIHLVKKDKSWVIKQDDSLTTLLFGTASMGDGEKKK